MRVCTTCKKEQPDQLFRKHSNQCGECRYRKLSESRGTFRPYSGSIQVGNIFGQLTVDDIVKFHNGSRNVCMAKCTCSCGETKLVKISHLTSGKTRSCGCANKLFKVGNQSHKWKGCGDIPAGYWNRVVRQATERGIEITVSIEHASAILEQQNGQCALTGLPIQFRQRWNTTASVDRIDSEKGYIPGNIQWLHKDVNLMKNKFSLQRFLEICELVTKKQQSILVPEIVEESQ